MTSPNGIPLPKTEPRQPLSSLRRGNIAAIDFGTTRCSLAYCLNGDLDNIQKAKLDRVSFRVPTAVLIDKEGTIIKFGNEAVHEWNQYCDDPVQKCSYFFFREIKMNLLREESITATCIIKAANGTEFFLIEVIALILRYIKNELITVDMKGIHNIKGASDFNWVITVPAIWKHRAKQLMREAAYLAGIAASESSVIQKLTVAEKNHWNQLISGPKTVDRNEVFPDQLTLALEPEAAALYCKNSENLPDVRSCLVADIGGGTVDITAITQDGYGEAKTLTVVRPPDGNDYGGTKVNQAIWKFLGELVDDPGFKRFSDAEYAPDMQDLEARIEEQKLFFGDAQEDSKVKKVVIRLPDSFKTTYSEALESNISQMYGTSGDVKLEGRRLAITFDMMEKFFTPAVDAINACIKECFETVSVEAVFLVGGFGGCNYIYRKVQPTAEAHGCSLFRALEHTTAVVTGAVMFRKNPEIFCARVADATYGTKTQTTFNTKYGHSKEYRIYDDDGDEQCTGLFSLMVAKGETLHRDRVIIHTYNPAKHDQKAMYFGILATNDKSPYYACEPNGRLMQGIREIGNVTVPMPDLRGDKSRDVKLTFDFSDTELHVEAYDETSGKKANTVVDFLGD